jgi:hypothetical protein
MQIAAHATSERDRTPIWNAGMSALEILGIGWLACDASGRLLYANETASRIFKARFGLWRTLDGRLWCHANSDPLMVAIQKAAAGKLARNSPDGNDTLLTPNGNTNTSTFNVTSSGPTGAVSLSGPLTIALPTGTATATDTFTLTNVSTNSASVTISNVRVAGGAFMTYLWTKVNSQDHCTNATLAPGASCTVGVQFTNIGSARNGTARNGTITFTDDATGTPQVGQLIGHAN